MPEAAEDIDRTFGLNLADVSGILAGIKLA